MHYSYTAALLAAVAVGQAVAGPFKHEHMHMRKHAAPLEVPVPVEKREPQSIDWATVSITYSSGQTFGSATSAASVAVATTLVTSATATSAAAPASTSVVSTSEDSTSSSTLLTSTDLEKIISLGLIAAGANAVSSAGGVWIGTDGPYTNEFSNGSGEDLILVIWGPAASWVNAQAPLITLTLANGESKTISFASGQSGAWSAIYSDTSLLNGQVSNTWGEYTFTPAGVVDVSREPNMDGHSMSIVGPDCTTDMTTCVFVCASGTTCLTDYELLDCAAGSQSGAQYGTYGGLPSGGCGWLGASSATFQTTLS